MIVCRRCHRELPESEFYPSCLKHHQRICKKCSNEKSKDYYNKDLEHSRKIRAKYAREHRELCRKFLREYRKRVKQSAVDLENAVMSMTDGYTIRVLNYAKKGEYKYSVDGNGKHFATNELKIFKNYIDKEQIF